MLNLASILTAFGFESGIPTKLVRHQDHRSDLEALYRAGQFDTYQSLQSRAAFAGCERIVSFLGRAGTTAVFVGVYDIEGVEGPADFVLPEDFLYPDMDTRGFYRYHLRRDTRFNELEGRLVVDWGRGTRSWVQHYRDGGKRVVEVLPEGYVHEFPGFMDVVLRHRELVRVIENRDAHREWHRMLGSVAGVYLILDTKTGNQYVGSAYGEGGLLSRWRTYANNVHGGNKLLKELLSQRSQLAGDLQFAVLQTLSVTLTAKEVIAHEVRHKNKLGTRAHGLNSN